MIDPSKCLAMMVFAGVMVPAAAHAHTYEICWSDNADGTTTVYASTNHTVTSGTTSGSLIVRGMSFPFTGARTISSTPPGTTCSLRTGCTNPGNSWQIVTIPADTLAQATHTFMTTTSVVEVMSSGCTSQSGLFGDSSCTDSDADGLCDPTVCGDGVRELGEDCDDGGESATCDADCTFVSCGDGTTNRTAGEACDEVGETSTCDTDCTDAICGDGLVNVTAGEACDAAGPSPSCDADCTLATCGDGTTNTAAGEECDDAGESSMCNVDCTRSSCGDGIVNLRSGEECDGGGESVMCDLDCTMPVCGDGTTNVAAGEMCDDGNVVDTDACLTSCIAASCGDSFVQEGVEQCDDGNTVDTDGCTNACGDPGCGDGVMQPGEECDDGNTMAGDGCTATCMIETIPDGGIGDGGVTPTPDGAVTGDGGGRRTRGRGRRGGCAVSSDDAGSGAKGLAMGVLFALLFARRRR